MTKLVIDKEVIERLTWYDNTEGKLPKLHVEALMKEAKPLHEFVKELITPKNMGEYILKLQQELDELKELHTPD